VKNVQSGSVFSLAAISQNATKRLGRSAFGAGKHVCGVLLFCAVVVTAVSAQTFSTLVSFDYTNGSTAEASPVQGVDGNLYGTALEGGAFNWGTVFKLTPDGTLTTIYTFCSQTNCTDGAEPEVGLSLGKDGNFYGTTLAGGAQFAGTIYTMTPEGSLRILYSFCSQTDCADGYGPRAVPVQATDGNFYGTTLYGGAYGDGDSFENNYGTVFKITPGGALTTLHSFDGTDGSNPVGLVQATDGNLYGTTETGGAYGYGTVFKITPQGSLSTLYNFCSQANCADGSEPTSALVQATNGSFYGTTNGGGANKDGTVFKITTRGVLTTLLSFDSNDGALPNGLVQASDGNLYGTTFDGGANAYGTLFEITAHGLTVLHSFDNTDGSHPGVGVSQATSGLLYGTTIDGGTSGDGTVFSFSNGLAPFVETIPSAGEVGENIAILGNGLEGSTSVSFNGIPAATFTSSRTAIKVVVPAGATTGTVEVTTATGKILKSNVPFYILP
jgi:uncharacterized repeat protein (TIGR03803 family)